MRITVEHQCTYTEYDDSKTVFVAEINGEYRLYIGDVDTYIGPHKPAPQTAIGMFTHNGNRSNRKYVPRGWNLSPLGWEWDFDHWKTNDRKVAQATATLVRPEWACIYTFYKEAP